MKHLLRALALLLVSSSAWGATWYVDLSGTGAGATDGTSYANRFAGWTDAWANAADIDAGDTVYACGTGTVTSAFGDNGSSDSVRLVVDGACPNGSGGIDQGIIAVNDTTCFTSLTTRSFITIQNLRFSGYTGNCIDARTATGGKFLSLRFIGTNNGSDTALIVGNAGAEVRGITILRSSAGISTRGCTNCLFSDIEIRDGGVFGTGSTANLDGFGLDDSAGVGCEGTIVENVRVYRQGSNQGSGIDFQCSAGTGTVTARRLFVTGGEGVGITVGSLSTLSHVISASVSTNNLLNAWYQKTTGTPATYYGIVGTQPAGSAQSAFRFGDGSSTGMAATIQNSVFIADVQTVSRTTTSGTLTDSYNNYFGPLHDTTNGTRTLSQWLADGQCAAGGCTSSNPMLEGGKNPLYLDGSSPLSASPLIGACPRIANINDFNGDQFDVPQTCGAFRGPRPLVRRTEANTARTQ